MSTFEWLVYVSFQWRKAPCAGESVALQTSVVMASEECWVLLPNVGEFALPNVHCRLAIQ